MIAPTVHDDATRAILTSRFLTRSGDQAWDFALPVTLALLMPTQMNLVILLFLLTKLATIFILPRLASIVDCWPRLKTSVLGTAVQATGVLVVTACVFALALLPVEYGLLHGVGMQDLKTLGLFSGIVAGAVAASLGSSLMEIALGNDWLPDLVAPDALAHVNSRMRQVDLAAEVGAPLVAGLLLLVTHPAVPLAGFLLVGLWNVVSFVPEILILRGIVLRTDALRTRTSVAPPIKKSPFSRFMRGWKTFAAQPAALGMVAYAFLWLSALSPHGVLLTTYLKGAWKMPELGLGLFRAGGAIFGLLATMAFTRVRARTGMVRTGFLFLTFQAVALLVALPLFFTKAFGGWAFLAAILVSRVGLYGFSLAETEIRQRSIPAGVRGEVNGVAAALTSFATLALFGLGSVFSTATRFGTLVVVSVGAVVVAWFIFHRWCISSRTTNLENT